MHQLKIEKRISTLNREKEAAGLKEERKFLETQMEMKKKAERQKEEKKKEDVRCLNFLTLRSW